jgi:hypothetical protein
MGLFSDLFGSSTHAQTTQSTSNVTNTELAGGDIGAPVVYGTGNSQTVNLQTTDAGTVQAATDISTAALELGANEANAGAAVAIAGLGHASDAYTSSLALVGDVTTNALNANTAVAQGSIDGIGQFTGKALDSVNRFAASALDSNTYIAGKSLDSTSAAYSASLNTVAGIAQQVTQSGQQATDQTVQKIVLYIVIGVALVFALKKG